MVYFYTDTYMRKNEIRLKNGRNYYIPVKHSFTPRNQFLKNFFKRVKVKRVRKIIMKSTEKKNFFLTYTPFQKSSNHSRHTFQMHSFKHSPNTYCISDLGHLHYFTSSRFNTNIRWGTMIPWFLEMSHTHPPLE